MHPLPILLNYELSISLENKLAYCAPAAQVKYESAGLIERHTPGSFRYYNSMTRAGERGFQKSGLSGIFKVRQGGQETLKTMSGKQTQALLLLLQALTSLHDKTKDHDALKAPGIPSYHLIECRLVGPIPQQV